MRARRVPEGKEEAGDSRAMPQFSSSLYAWGMTRQRVCAWRSEGDTHSKEAISEPVPDLLHAGHYGLLEPLLIGELIL